MSLRCYSWSCWFFFGGLISFFHTRINLDAPYTEMLKLNNQTQAENEKASIDGALYQIGRTAVLSNQFTQQGIQALEEYINKEIDSKSPSKNWARYRLAMLHVTNSDKVSAKKMRAFAINDKHDKGLRKRAKKLLKKIKS